MLCYLLVGVYEEAGKNTGQRKKQTKQKKWMHLMHDIVQRDPSHLHVIRAYCADAALYVPYVLYAIRAWIVGAGGREGGRERGMCV